MLVELSIHKIALIENLQLQLDRGLLVFTGETGAGKSILLDSIGLLLGNRASVDLIRTGADTAVVEAMFQLSGNALEESTKLLHQWGLSDSEGGLLVSRELHRSGRTVCRINGRIATVQMLKELGEKLVQQHGQHEQHGLLKTDEQMRLLDLYARNQEYLAEVRTCYQRWTHARDTLKKARMNEQERVQRLDMLEFQIDEIERAELKVGEEEELKELRSRLQHADRIYGSIQSAVTALQGANRQSGAIDLLASAAEEVAAAVRYDNSLSEVTAFIDTAQVHIDEAVRVLSKQLATIESDPSRLEWAESRYAQIRTLQRKYGATVEDILDYLERCRQEREKLLHHEEQAVELEKAVAYAEAALKRVSGQLHEARRKMAEKLSIEVQQVLRDLSMPSATLDISVTERIDDHGKVLYGPSGTDTVTFLFSANKGDDAKPLHKIASGGELSRTLLAFKSVLAAVDDMETLIFDEIDAGVSGVASNRIAERLRALGKTRQVLCVTHAPQIAAAAHGHYQIVKHERKTDTTTSVTSLTQDGRVSEIARLVGADLSDRTAVQHAEALLQSFQTAQ